jgi:hypothetical protein
LAERSPRVSPSKRLQNRRAKPASPPDQRPLLAFPWTSEFLSRTTCAILVKRSRLELIARQANEHPSRFISSGVLHHSLVMSHPLMPLARFESLSRFHRFPSEPEHSNRSRSKWEIRRTLVPSRREPPVRSLRSPPHDAPSRDIDDPKGRLNHATVRGASPEVGHHFGELPRSEDRFGISSRRVDPVGIVLNDFPHARSEDRGALSRIASTPLELVLPFRPAAKALRRAPQRSFGPLPLTQASPSSKNPKFRRSEEHRTFIFSPAELFQKPRQFFKTHILRRKSSSLETTMTSVELAAHLPLSFCRPEGQLPPTEKLTSSSKKGSSANRPSVGFPSL